MDLYTLDENFLANTNVEKFISAIWTERYSSAGDCQIVLPATDDNITKLAEGTFLALRGSDEVMILETQSIDNKLLTVVGKDLLSFLNERLAWFKNPAYNSLDDPPPDLSSRVIDLTLDTKKPGEFISYVVDKSVINTITFSGDYADATLDWTEEVIPYLTLGDVDTSGVVKRLTAAVGPLYDSIQQVAEKEGVGISLYLESADGDTGYSLKFKTYRGVDHTTGGAGTLIRLSPDFETISDLKEVHSIADWKNVAYVYYQGEITKHLEDGVVTEPEGFDRRVLLTNAEGEPVGRKVTNRFGGTDYGSYIVVGPTEIAAFRAQNAKDALANHNYIRTIDGQTSPHNEYKFGVDYGLGDLIELEGITGNITKSRVTEYIRSQDQNGEKEYPTISVVS